MSINALGIDVLDPGAVPGGSTINHLKGPAVRRCPEQRRKLSGWFLMGPK